MNWAVAVTTVSPRVGNLLDQTLRSLVSAGFPNPHIFGDGLTVQEIEHLSTMFPESPLTVRFPRIRTAGNWGLALAEVYVRQPKADLYAVFQDDVVCCRNLRQYVEQSLPVEKGYLNLMTFMDNENVIKNQPIGWHEAGLCSRPKDRRLGKQTGRSAAGLVFDREAVVQLLSRRDFIERFQNEDRGWRRIDGGVVEQMNCLGYREFVHNPSLIQHAGDQSTMHERGQHKRNGELTIKYKNWGNLKARTFPGESHDALEFLKAGAPCCSAT